MAKKKAYFAKPKESRGAKGFNLMDNAQANTVKSIATDTEGSDLGRMRYASCGDKGYASQAFAYDY